MDKTAELDRETWSRKLDFILSCIGFSVGMGNIWRFPYMAYRHGGATFLIPYLVMLVIAGLPLYFMELAVGQFASEGPITVWKLSPIFTGIGFAMVSTTFMICVYYNVVVTYAMYYLFVSLVNLDLTVPWASCDNDWNTVACRTEPYPDLSSLNESTKLQRMYDDLYNSSCVREMSKRNSSNVTFDDINSTMLSDDLYTHCSINYTSSSAEYWERFVLRLQESDGIGDLGSISPKLLVSFILAWLLVFCCLLKGIKSTGKVVYFTATFPFIILFMLLVRGLTLPGYEIGVKYYIIPQPEKLLDAKVWGDAATQIFYSLGVALGVLPALASYNKFTNNCYRDAIVVAVINCATSIFAGFVIFSLLGFMANVTNQDISEVVDQGPGLVFIAFPEGLARLPVSPLWSFLFFLMVITIGLDSQFAQMESVISGITDVFPHVLRKHKALFTFAVCFLCFLLGLPQVTTGGIYILTLLDWYCGSYNLMVIALLEVISIMYVYGIKNFRCDIETMLGFKPNCYWMVTWLVMTPAAILFFVVTSAYQYTPASYGTYVFPSWAQGVGLTMVAVPVAFIVLLAIIQANRYGFINSTKSTSDWGPRNPANQNSTLTDTELHNKDIQSGSINLGYLQDSDKTTNGHAARSPDSKVLQNNVRLLYYNELKEGQPTPTPDYFPVNGRKTPAEYINIEQCPAETVAENEGN